MTRHYLDPDQRIATGREALGVVTRRFFAQLKQPKWLALSAALYPGTKQHLHSSQISGFGNGKLKDPSPKAFTALGQLNLALYASLHGPFEYEGIGTIPTLPDNLRPIWAGLTPMVDPSGQPLGPVELFEIMIGTLDMGLLSDRVVPDHAEAAASTALGKYIRLSLATQGRDFMEEMPTLRNATPHLETLLMGRTVPAPILPTLLPTIATATGLDPDHLWLAIADAIAATPPPTNPAS